MTLKYIKKCRVSQARRGRQKTIERHQDIGERYKLQGEREEAHCASSLSSDLAESPAKSAPAVMEKDRRAINKKMKDLNWYRQLEGLVENSPDGEVTCGPDGRITFANAKASELLGKLGPELVGKTYGEAVRKLTNLAGESLDESALPPSSAVRTGRAVLDFEHVVELAGGGRRIISANARPLTDEGGRVTQVIMTLRDITEHHRADDRLRESERHYRMLAESSDDYIYVVDRDERVRYANLAATRLFAGESEDLLGRGLEKVFGGKLYERLKKSLPVVFFMGRGITVDGAARLEGRDAWLAIRLIPLRDPEGNVSAVMLVSKDNTERRTTEKALKASERRYHTLFAESPVSLWEGDLSKLKRHLDRLQDAGVDDFHEYFHSRPDEVMRCARLIRVTDVNRATLELFGAESVENFTEHLGEVIAPALEIDFADQMAALAEGQTRYESETRARTLAGEVKDIAFRMLVPPGYEDTLSRVIVSVVDISRRLREKALDDALRELNATVTSGLRFEHVVSAVVRRGAEILGCDWGALIVRESEGWVVKQVSGFPESAVGRRLSANEFVALRQIIETKRGLVSDDAAKDCRFNRKKAKEMGVRAFLATPLIAKEKVTGAFFFGYHRPGPRFTDLEVNFVQNLAVSVALSLENARYYEAELEVSQTLQETMLTMPRRLEGIDFDYLYRSAAEAARVGGDFYDLFETGPGTIGIVIGDVSGKGLEAATMTSVAKNTIRAYAYQHASPALVASLTNEAVVKVTGESAFVTAFIGILNKRSGRLAYCGAGHPPALIRRADGGIVRMDTRCPAFGVFRDLSYEDSFVDLAPGDRLVLYTDGVIEARRNGELFGEERLAALISEWQSGGGPLSRTIYDCIEAFAGPKLTDDIALLTLGLVLPA